MVFLSGDGPDGFHAKRILILGRFDTPTYHVSEFSRKNFASVALIRTSMQIDKAMPLLHLSVGSTHSFKEVLKIREPFIHYAANIYLRHIQYIINYVIITSCIAAYSFRPASYDLVIGVGPLNGVLAYLYSRIHHNTKTVYYAEDKIADNAKDLFGKLTKTSDDIAQKYCHAIWVMSEAYLHDIRRRMVSKFTYVPVPMTKYLGKQAKKREGKSIVFLGSIAPEHGYDMLYTVFKRLLKDMPSLRLIIIGSGERAAEFVRQYTREGMAKSIEYKGFIADNSRVLSIISRASVGVCLYNPAVYKNLAFGQSSKITNYIACGLPVILTGTKENMPSLALYVRRYHAGYVLGYNEEQVYRALKRLLTNEDLYTNMKKNVDLIPHHFDNHTHYMRAFEKLLSVI